jgi:hypothetical protein
MVSHRKDVVQGTLDLLVLRIIATQPMPEGRWECRRVTRYVNRLGFPGSRAWRTRDLRRKFLKSPTF